MKKHRCTYVQKFIGPDEFRWESRLIIATIPDYSTVGISGKINQRHGTKSSNIQETGNHYDTNKIRIKGKSTEIFEIKKQG